MKKNLILILIFFIGLSINVKAETTNEIIINSAKNTINKAVIDRTAIKIDSSHNLTILNDPNIFRVNLTNNLLMNGYDESDAVVFNLLNYIKSILSASDNLNYNTTINSCNSGIFSDTKSDIGRSISSIGSSSKEIRCAINGKNWAISVKTTDSYLCVDNTSSVTRTSGLLDIGVSTCKGLKKAAIKTDKYSIKQNFTIFPKQNNVYDILFNINYLLPKDTVKGELFSQGDGAYILIDKYIMKLLHVKNEDYVNKYLKIDNDIMLYDSLHLDNSKLKKLFNLVLSDKYFTSKFINKQSDGTNVYEIYVPYNKLQELSYYIPNIYYSGVIGLLSSNKDKLKLRVNIKDGTIIRVYTINSTMSNKNIKDSFSIDISIKNNYIPIAKPASNITVSCSQLLPSDMSSLCMKSADFNKKIIEDESDTKKSADAGLKSYLSNMRAVAELYYSNKDNYGPYTLSCTSGMFASAENSNNVKLLVDSIKNLSNDVVCHAAPSSGKSLNDSSTWVMSAKLKSGDWYCVDYTGVAGNKTSQLTDSDTRCK